MWDNLWLFYEKINIPFYIGFPWFLLQISYNMPYICEGYMLSFPQVHSPIFILLIKKKKHGRYMYIMDFWNFSHICKTVRFGFSGTLLIHAKQFNCRLLIHSTNLYINYNRSLNPKRVLNWRAYFPHLKACLGFKHLNLMLIQ